MYNYFGAVFKVRNTAARAAAVFSFLYMFSTDVDRKEHL